MSDIIIGGLIIIGCLFIFGLMSYLVVESHKKRHAFEITITDIDQDKIIAAAAANLRKWSVLIKEHENQTAEQPISPKSTLGTKLKELQQAIDEEDYEKAVELRDEIKNIQAQAKNPKDEDQTK